MTSKGGSAAKSVGRRHGHVAASEALRTCCIDVAERCQTSCLGRPSRRRRQRLRRYSRDLYSARISGVAISSATACRGFDGRCREFCLPKTTTTCAASWTRRCRTPATTSSSFDNGSRAYERLREEPFTLLLTDIVMPEMDGIELARRATELDPDLKVMFITGFAAVALNPDSTRPRTPRSCRSRSISRTWSTRSRSCSRPEAAAA